MTKTLAGFDLGKATARLAMIEVDSTGAIHVQRSVSRLHKGRPLETFAALYVEAQVPRCKAAGSTGTYAGDLVEPMVAGLPEDACLEAASRLLPTGPLNVVNVGARGYAVLTRDSAGRTRFVESDKCSSGTGETMVKIAGRFGMSIEEADEAARGAKRATPITARCSVFAKSEMTHYGNQGYPRAGLFKGYFDSVANNVAALLERVRVEGPVYVIGGCSRLASLREALARAVGCPVEVPEYSCLLGAIGAARLAGEHAGDCDRSPLPEDPGPLIKRSTKQISTLEPAGRFAERVVRLEAEPLQAPRDAGPVILGLDLGSTGSKGVLCALETGALVADVYDRTRGNPVDAAQRLVRALLREGAAEALAIGVTGSGREAVATVLRASFPDAGARILVQNEIVAHATAAIRCDEGGGEDLSIIEIGGQDAKFVQVAGGRIVESDMNRACSAGTGSFLEEQAQAYGVDDVGELGRRAAAAKSPPNLGQMCTVFVAEAAGEALKQGYSTDDLFAGFEYSVIFNYLHRVMGQRTLGRRVFFQGKPATSPSLARTLAAVTGREIVVPANPGAMGAWGIALEAIEMLGQAVLDESAGLDLAEVLDAKVVGRREVICREPGCRTYCAIDKTRVSVNGKTHTILSGGACPKYEISGMETARPPRDAPNPFEAREALLEPFFTEPDGKCDVAIPMVGEAYRLLPYFRTFFDALGLKARVVRPAREALLLGVQRCHSSDVCCPIKIAHGLPRGGNARTFLPKVLEVSGGPGAGGSTCAMKQALPEMIEQDALDRGESVRMIRPVMSLGHGLETREVCRAWCEVASQFGIDGRRVRAAVKAAAAVHLRYERALWRLGEETLRYGRAHGWPVVMVCGPQHVLHEPAINARIPMLVRENGALALPVDCMPLGKMDGSMSAVHWADSILTLRAARGARARGGVFPLLLSSFGCAQASFTEQLFQAVLKGYPHTLLESDGHGGAAGYVTRIQAFMHSVRRHPGTPSPLPDKHVAFAKKITDSPLDSYRDARLVVFTLDTHLGPAIAAAYRSLGYDAVASGPTSASSLALARKDCSGKECLPYQLIWGAFREYLEAHPPDKRTVLLQIPGASACRNALFSTKDRLSLERLGYGDRVEVHHFRAAYTPAFAAKAISAVIALDLIKQLYAYYGAGESVREQAHRLYTEHSLTLIELLESRWTPEADSKGDSDTDSQWRNAHDSTSSAARSRSGHTGVVPGLLERLARRPLDRLAAAGRDPIARLERFGRQSWHLLDGFGRDSRVLLELIDRVSSDFEALAFDDRERGDAPTVLLTGDIYVRHDDFGGDGILGRLHDQGLHVLIEPVSLLVEYVAEERTSDLVGLPTTPLEHKAVQLGLTRVRDLLYSRVRRKHPWLPVPEIKDLLSRGTALLNRFPRGEAPITVSSTMYNWQEGHCDGVVVSSPWGCGPALISEALLSHQRDIPLLFLYNDGHPLDGRKVRDFAFRLRRMGVHRAR